MELKNQVICGDCLDVLPRMPENYFDLVITSPQYNVDLGNNKHKKNGYDVVVDNKDHWEFIDGLRMVFNRIYRALKPGGRVVINIGDGKNGRIPTHAHIIHMMCRELHYLMFAEIIWNKNQTSPRNAWGSWMSPSCPSFPTPFEYILVFAKETLKHTGQTKISTVTKEEFIRNSLAIWTFAPEKRQKELGHPAPFPVELPRRCIQQLSYEEDRVLDPFGGVGTTGVACQEQGREYTLIDVSPDYCDTSRERLGKGKGGETY